MGCRSGLLVSGALAAALAASGGSARAQTAAEPSAQVGEIVVTAQRRSERLQDVPMSVTALSAEALAQAGITNTADIARVTPAVTMPFYGAFLQPAIRGVSSTGANIGDNSNVALYLDGVYQPQQIASLIDLPDVQQVEILKGPQGALYGQNATGGAILVTSQTPSFTTSGRFSASYGNRDAVQLRGYVTGALTDQIAASLAGGYQDRDGFRKHVVTGERDRGLTSKVVRGKVLFQPTSAAKVTLTGYYSDRSDSSMYAGVPLNGNSIGYLLIPGAPVPSSPKQFGATPGVFSSIESYGGVITGAFDTDAGTINTITSYSENEVHYLADVDFSPVDFAEAYANLNAHYFVQEANFVSRQFGRFSFLAGGLYINGSEEFDPSGFRTFAAPSLPPTPQSDYSLMIPQYGRIDKEILAAYGSLVYQLTDKLTVTADGRYTRERQHGYNNLSPAGFDTIVEFPDGAVTFSKFTPRLTARYELTPASNVYASWGKGFKSGIINTANFSQAPVRPERITAYEVGYKGRPLPNLTFNVAAFYYDYRDLQVVAYAPPEYIQQNAASARIKGLDLDASWAVTPDLTLSGGLAFLDAQYRDFPAAQIFVPTGVGNLAVTADLSGLRMLRAPRFTGNLAANYQRDTAAGRFGAYAAYYYNSGFGFEVSNRLRQGAYATVDAELSFAPSRVEGLRLVLWGKNLGDRDYLASVLASNFADGGSYAEPRTYGVRAEYQF